MELFQNFDDDVFTESRSREKETELVSYNAKFSEKEWFTSATALCEETEVDDKIQVLKYKGELHFYRRQYSESLANFDAVLELVKPYNLPLRRDIDESRCRSLMALSRPIDALHIALHLHQVSQNYDQKSNTLALLVKCYDKLRLPSTATVCTQRLLALHPLNPEYWIQFAEFCEQTPVSTTSTVPRDNSHDKATQPSRLSLYNPDYPCRMCMRENCTLCCIYRHKVTDIRTQIEECCDDCPEQDSAPEVHFQSTECTCMQQQRTKSTDAVCTVKQTRHGCTTLLQTPRRTHVRSACFANNEARGDCHKQENCDISDLCDKLENENMAHSENRYLHKRKADMGVDTKKAVCISLVRARYLLKNIEINLVSFAKDRYRDLSTRVEEWLAKLSLTAEEKTFYEKWTSSDFGLDSQGKCRASSPFNLTKDDCSGKPGDSSTVHVFNKSEEVVDACDLDVTTWFSLRWLKPPANLQL